MPKTSSALPTKHKEALSARLKWLREERNMSPREFSVSLIGSEKLKSRVWRWEHGLSMPSFDEIVDILMTLDQDPIAFFTSVSDDFATFVEKGRHEKIVAPMKQDEILRLQELSAQYEEQCDVVYEVQGFMDTMMMTGEVWMHYAYVSRGHASTGNAREAEQKRAFIADINARRLQTYMDQATSPSGHVRSMNAIFSLSELISFTIGAGVYFGLEVRKREQQLQAMVNLLRTVAHISIWWVPTVSARFGVFGNRVILLMRDYYYVYEDPEVIDMCMKQYEGLKQASKDFMEHGYAARGQVEDRNLLREDDDPFKMLPLLRALEYLRVLREGEATAGARQQTARLLARIGAPAVGKPILGSIEGDG